MNAVMRSRFGNVVGALKSADNSRHGSPRRWFTACRAGRATPKRARVTYLARMSPARRSLRAPLPWPMASPHQSRLPDRDSQLLRQNPIACLAGNCSAVVRNETCDGPLALRAPKHFSPRAVEALSRPTAFAQPALYSDRRTVWQNPLARMSATYQVSRPSVRGIQFEYDEPIRPRSSIFVVWASEQVPATHGGHTKAAQIRRVPKRGGNLRSRSPVHISRSPREWRAARWKRLPIFVNRTEMLHPHRISIALRIEAQGFSHHPEELPSGMAG